MIEICGVRSLSPATLLGCAIGDLYGTFLAISAASPAVQSKFAEYFFRSARNYPVKHSVTHKHVPYTLTLTEMNVETRCTRPKQL